MMLFVLNMIVMIVIVTVIMIVFVTVIMIVMIVLVIIVMLTMLLSSSLGITIVGGSDTPLRCVVVQEVSLYLYLCVYSRSF